MRCKVGIKYCGGCNPRYDRAGLVSRLAAACPGALLTPTGEGGPWDAVLVVCGCPVCCADHQGLEGKAGKLMISKEEDFPSAAALLQGL